jgi:hypothetical protein
MALQGYMKRKLGGRWIVAGSVALLAALVLRGDARQTKVLLPAGVKDVGPPIMLWAWEEPESLEALDPQKIGVVFLAERIFLGDDVQVQLRRQRIETPPGIYAMAVVRLEALPGFIDSSQLRNAAAEAILRASRLPGIRGVQVDFDATASQRSFYTGLLNEVRSRMPAGATLTMTALVSWCAESNGWLKQLPIDAAVPMYFRLGKHTGNWTVREPLCAGYSGVSIDEPGVAPRADGVVTTYLFSPQPWTATQITTLNREGLPEGMRGQR